MARLVVGSAVNLRRRRSSAKLKCPATITPTDAGSNQNILIEGGLQR